MVLHTWNLLRVEKCSQHLKKELTKWGDGYVNYFDHGDHSTIYMYIILFLKPSMFFCDSILEKNAILPTISGTCGFAFISLC